MHIYEHDQHRENQAIQTLLTGLGVPPGPAWLRHLGWNPANCWFALNIPTQRVLNNPPATAPGDIDVLGGPLEAPDDAWAANLSHARSQVGSFATEDGVRSWAWNLSIAQRDVVWPPRMEHVAIAEFKAGRFSADGTGKGKTHRDAFQADARRQAGGLCDLGFSRVALAYVLGGEQQARPGDPDGVPWLRAAYAAKTASWAFGGRLLFEEADPFATLVLPISAVTSGGEALDGATGPAEGWNEGVTNPVALTSEGQRFRGEITAKIVSVMAAVPFPGRVPVLVLACKYERCGKLYVAGSQGAESRCRDCGGPSTVSTQP